MTVHRITQTGAEFVSSVDPIERLTQVGAEFVTSVTPVLRLFQVGAEVVSDNVPDGVGSGGSPVMLFIAT